MAEVKLEVEWRNWGHLRTPRLFTRARVDYDSTGVVIWARNEDADHPNYRVNHWLVQLRWVGKDPNLSERRRAARQAFDLLRIHLNIQGDLTWPK